MGVPVPVVELPNCSPGVVGELVVPGGKRLQIESPVIAGELSEGVGPARPLVPPEDGGHGHALDSVGGGHSGQIQQSGHEVHVLGDLGIAGALGHHAGPLEDHGGLDEAVVVEGALEEEAVVPISSPWSEVKRMRVSSSIALVPEGLEDPADAVVHQADHAVVGGLDLPPLAVGEAAVVVLLVAAPPSRPVAAEVGGLVLQLPSCRTGRESWSGSYMVE